MPKFAELQQRASKLSKRFDSLSETPRTIFFKPLCSLFDQDNSKLGPIFNTIQEIALSLGEAQEKSLIVLVQGKKTTKIETCELEEFKMHVLVGAYLFYWLNNSSNSLLSDFFKKDLETSLNAMDNSYINLCLDAFSDFSAFAYRENDAYKELAPHVGYIQGEILKVKITLGGKKETSWTENVFNEIVGLTGRWSS